MSLLVALSLVAGCAESHMRGDGVIILLPDAGMARPPGGGVRDAGDPPALDAQALDAQVPDAQVPDGGSRDPWQFGVVESTCYSPGRAPEWAIVVSDTPGDCDTMNPLHSPIRGTHLNFWFWGDLSERTYALEPFPFGEASLQVLRGTTSWAHEIREGTVVVERFTPDGEAVLRWSATLEEGTTVEGRARVVTFCPIPPLWPEC